MQLKFLFTINLIFIFLFKVGILCLINYINFYFNIIIYVIFCNLFKLKIDLKYE